MLKGNGRAPGVLKKGARPREDAGRKGKTDPRPKSGADYVRMGPVTRPHKSFQSSVGCESMLFL